MTIELPVLHLGLAGFSARQREALAQAVLAATTRATAWQLGELHAADAWWVNGAQARIEGGNRIRVATANCSEPALQLHLPDIDRPVAFSLPLACPELEPTYSFDPSAQASVDAVLAKFEAWLAPVSAQFSLAAHVAEHERALGSGIFDVMLNGVLVAVVNMHGEIGVLPTAGPADFEDALWRRLDAAPEIPEHFVRSSLAHLMWQYAVRTQRDVLPRHYRANPLYFRRPPRLPQRMLKDSQLLLMRELVGGPATFQALQQRTGLDEVRLARDLAALYFVGSITSNPKRAARPPQRAMGCAELAQGPRSSLPSALDSDLPADAPTSRDLTAPAPLRPH